ncbi:MAG: hypothetical protein ISS53_06465 [Dehalococcoidia bacterium]|nr:hypothetical protein [Dehalococcoidia bacterium]
MVVETKEIKWEDVGSWQRVFKRTCSERVQKAITRARTPTEICLERARAEIKAYEQYKDEPRVIQRARVLETYLREKTVFILEGDLIVGNVVGKVRGSPVFAECAAKWIDEELDSAERDFLTRKYDPHIISPEERKELREVILPYWKGKTLEDENLSVLDTETIEKTFPSLAASPCIPQLCDRMSQQDAGKQMTNYEKVLWKGLKGIKEEAEWYMAQLDQPYMHYGLEEKRDFYKAAIIGLDAVMAYAKRYADLARETAAKEADPKRKAELERVAEVCDRVPANPARDWWEALQSVWFIQVIIHCEFLNLVNSFGRFDQYMYPFYKKSVIDEKTMTRDQALELLECFFVKTSEFTSLMSFDVSKVQTGFPMTQTLIVGGQTRDGKDAVNDVSWLCVDADKQVGLIQPDFSIRVWEGTPHDFLKKALDAVRLGRGKPKFYFDRTAIRMASKAFPHMTIKDWREYAVEGCTELSLPHYNMCHSALGLANAAKLVELVLNNGKCALTGKQIGPVTGDPRSFESMTAVRQALREQIFYWTPYMAKATKVQMDIQYDRMHGPFCSSLIEGPLEKGVDLIQGGAWTTTYGFYLACLADAGDSLAVIDRLIYRDRKVTWDQLLEALKANWEGHEDLRQLCIESVPKYGNDNDYADEFPAFVMDTWQDVWDWINTQENLKPRYGGTYQTAGIAGNSPVAYGAATAALPNGHINPQPLADTYSPSQGLDREGITAVMKSVGKLPIYRYTMGGLVNQRLSPQVLETDRDLDNFAALLKTCNELGVFQLQLNVISSDLLRKAIKDPDEYRDLMIRVASWCSYFVDLDPGTQLDIIARTEQTEA